MFSTKILGMFLVLLWIRGVVSQSFRSDEGPYKTVISNVTSCALPLNWFQWNMTTYSSKGQSLLRGTISFSRSIKELKFRVLLYYLEERKTKVFDMRNQNCHNTIIEVILKMVTIPFNHHTCRMEPGTYEFKDLNMDAIIHTVVQSLWYGTAELRLEARDRKATCMCLDSYVQALYYEVRNSNFVSSHPAHANVISYESERDGMIRTSNFEFRGNPSD